MGQMLVVVARESYTFYAVIVVAQVFCVCEREGTEQCIVITMLLLPPL